MANASAAPPEAERPFWLARSTRTIFFFAAMLTVAGIYLSFQVPISVFPETNFPRVVIGVDNGVMPVEQMEVTITGPSRTRSTPCPGLQTVRSTTSRGSAEVSLFFDWNVDMVPVAAIGGCGARQGASRRCRPRPISPPTGSPSPRFPSSATASPPTPFRRPSCGRLPPTI